MIRSAAGPGSARLRLSGAPAIQTAIDCPEAEALRQFASEPVAKLHEETCCVSWAKRTRFEMWEMTEWLVDEEETQKKCA